jgi:hypothetical protein
VPHRTRVPSPDSPPVSRPAYPTGVVVAIGFTVVVAGCLVAALVLPPNATTGRLIILSVDIAGFAAIAQSRAAALVTAALSWPFYLGFLVDQHGELSWHGPIDLMRLFVLVAAALGGSSCGNGWWKRSERNRKPWLM